MDDKILNEILAEVKKISVYISQKAKKEQLKEDLSGLEIDSTVAAACKKVGDDTV